MDKPGRTLSPYGSNVEAMALVPRTRSGNRIRITKYALVLIALIIGGIFVSVGDARLTSARLLGVVLLVGLLGRTFFSFRIRLGGVAGVILLVWLFMSLGIDFYRPESSVLLKHWLSIASGIVWFYIIVNAEMHWDCLERAIKAVGLIVGVVAVLALIAKFATFDPYGITTRLVPDVGGGFRLVLLSWEPNIFGAIVAMMLVALVPNVASRLGRVRSVHLIFLLLLIALVGSLSKGPWLAFIVGISVYALIAFSGRVAKLAFSFIGVGSAALVVLLVMTPAQILDTVGRVNNFSVRMTHIQFAVHDFVAKPLLGNGTFSLSALWPHLNAQFGSTGAWVGQTVISVLHDTGIIGLVLIVSFWVILMGRAVITIRNDRWYGGAPRARLFASAIVGAAAVLITMGFATTLYGLPIYWAVMGLVANIPRWLENSDVRMLCG